MDPIQDSDLTGLKKKKPNKQQIKEDQLKEWKREIRGSRLGGGEGGTEW